MSGFTYTGVEWAEVPGWTELDKQREPLERWTDPDARVTELRRGELPVIRRAAREDEIIWATPPSIEEVKAQAIEDLRLAEQARVIEERIADQKAAIEAAATIEDVKEAAVPTDTTDLARRIAALESWAEAQGVDTDGDGAPDTEIDIKEPRRWWQFWRIGR